MSASKKKQIEIVIRKLTDQLAIAQTELSLIQSYDENGKILPDIKMEEDEGRILVSPCVADDHYGMLMTIRPCRSIPAGSAWCETIVRLDTCISPMSFLYLSATFSASSN